MLKKSRSGFTLVEMSMVLLIIGLIAGGVLVGRALIRQAALFSVTRDITKFQTMHYTFYTKYNAYPGDMENATQFWGFAGAQTTINGKPNCANPLDDHVAGNNQLTCNGNGDGIVGHIPGAPGTSWDTGPGFTGWQSESFRYWQHLANAGLISGEFTGIPDGTGFNHNSQMRDATVNLNVPGSSSLGGGFMLSYPKFGSLCRAAESTNYVGEDAGAGTLTDQGSSYQMMMFGREVGTDNNSGGPPAGDVITPIEASSIDGKVDDGRPGTGNLRSFCFANSDTTYFECVDDDGAAGRMPSRAIYRADDEHIACHVRFILR